MRVKDLFLFMHERHRIYQRRATGQRKPWTQDKILQQYRFCNVYRELDTVTQWIAKNWRLPHRADPNLWFAMCVARLVNWPPTLERMGWPVPWATKHFIKTMHTQPGYTQKVWSGAYIVSTNGNEMEKADYIANRVLTPLWDDRKKIWAGINNETLGAVPPPTLADVHRTLTRYTGLGSFLAAQVIADLKYVAPLRSAIDWYTWAASGPGSRRGLSRVCGVAVNVPWNEETWLITLQKLHRGIMPLLKSDDMPRLHAQDLQNCLCEFDKYERARLGEGRPRSKYPGV